MKNLNNFAKKKKINKWIFLAQIIVCIILLPLILLSIIIFKICDTVVEIYKNIKRGDNKNEERN